VDAGGAQGGTFVPETGKLPEVSVKTVLFATDFSECSENTGHYARLLAESLHASLLVAHAFLLSEPAQEIELVNHSASKQRTDLEALLAALARDLSTPQLVAAPVLVVGAPHEAIPLLAEKHAPALLVLGTHGAGRVMHELMGSVAEEILRSTRWPCLTVGPHAPQLAQTTRPFRRVLIATDFTPAASRAAAFAINFSRVTGGSLEVMNVLPESARSNPAEWKELEERYTRALEQIVPEQARQFLSPHTFVESGNAHQRILAHIREHQIDLLVLGIRKASHLGLEMRTSGAFHLIANAACPVLTITS
jgi:nucleotide-binding universal stress UspA family protein